MSAESTKHTIVHRKNVPSEHTWDLSVLYASDEAWEQECQKFEEYIGEAR